MTQRHCEHGRSTAQMLIFFVAALLIATAGWGQGPAFGTPNAVTDHADDPPGVLDTLDSSHVVDLGMKLTADRTWLTEEVLETLDTLSLRLDEVFTAVPNFFTGADGAHYRIKLEKTGDLWDGFDAAEDRFAIFLSHESYTGLGEDRVLAFVDGTQTVLFEKDFASLPTLALVVQDHTFDEPVAKSAHIGDLQSPIALGAAQLDIKRFSPQMIDGFPLAGVNLKAGCAHEVAPGCSGGGLTCSGGAAPHFVVTALKIKTDHEGAFKGNPEIELFPLNIDGTATGSSSARSTIFQFDGRTITDYAGRSRFLPDINNENVWYTIAGGVSICPAVLGSQWSATLVEQDDQRGVLKMRGDRQNRTIMFNFEFGSTSQNPRQTFRFDFFKFLESAAKLVLSLFQGDGDDLFQDSIGITGNLFCNQGVGQPFPRTFTLSSGEWDLQGYFACINPSCAAMTANISGPAFADAWTPASFSANVNSGVTPYTYRWTKNGGFIGSGSSVSVTSSNNYTIALRVTDAAGQVVNSSRYVQVEEPMCGDFFC